MAACRTRLLAFALCAMTAAGCGSDEQGSAGTLDADDAPPAQSFALETVADGFVRPTFVSAAPGDRGALWVLEQTGRLVRLRGDRRTTVLDLSDRIAVGAEQGALGVAFHPGFARNRTLYVDFTDRAGDTRVVEYRLGHDGRASAADGRVLLSVDQPEENHNGGALVFGTDGRLFVGMGDGGGAFDPRDQAQDPRSRLGKLLAADVDGPGPPRWEIVLSGLRNPWRLWFDPAMNEIWIGDVGQDSREEIDRVAYEPDEPPKNLGWPVLEGTRTIGDRTLRGGGELVAPVVEYSHSEGCSVTGGSVYRGTRVPTLEGRYLFGDFCSGRIWTVRPQPGGSVTDLRAERARAPQLTHIGTDGDGELVLATADGRLLRAVRPRAR